MTKNRNAANKRRVFARSAGAFIASVTTLGLSFTGVTLAEDELLDTGVSETTQTGVDGVRRPPLDGRGPGGGPRNPPEQNDDQQAIGGTQGAGLGQGNNDGQGGTGIGPGNEPGNGRPPGGGPDQVVEENEPDNLDQQLTKIIDNFALDQDPLAGRDLPQHDTPLALLAWIFFRITCDQYTLLCTHHFATDGLRLLVDSILKYFKSAFFGFFFRVIR